MAAAILVIAVVAWVVHWPKIAPRFSIFYWETVQYLDHVQQYVHSVPDAFRVPPLWPGLYRPLSTNLYFYLGLKWFGPGVEHFKVFNLLLYIANAILLFRFAWRHVPWAWALTAAVLFATRDAHVDIVTTAVEAQSLLAVFFSLLALNTFASARETGRSTPDGVALAAFAFALFCKETAIVMPVVLVAYCWLLKRRFPWRWIGAHAAVAAVWTAFFVSVFRGIRDHAPTGFRYTASPRVILHNVAGHLVDFSNVLVANLEETNMNVNRRMYDITRHAGTLVATGAVILATAAGTVKRARLGTDARVAVFGMVLFVLATSPYLLFPDRLYMRYSYAGHAGVALTVAMGIKWLWERLYPRMRAWGRRRAGTA